MTITETVTKRIIRKLLRGEDYRIEVVTLIDASFLNFAIGFFKKVVDAKLANQNVTADWYKKELLNPKLHADEIAIHSGLNKKTISNMYNKATRNVVINASNAHYESLYESISTLAESEEDLDLTLTLKLKGVSVDLNITETLIVINTIAVKRAALRGGLWSTAGKRVEKPLMQVLCGIYEVPKNHYQVKLKSAHKKENEFAREIDFYLIKGESNFKCEVKLMGKGNPEGADAVVARSSKVFIADKLSELNKTQLDSLGVEWVELRSNSGFQRFKKVLENLKIPHRDIAINSLDDEVEKIFTEIFQ